MSDLSEQIDALLALNAKGAVSHPVPGLAVELLERVRDTLSALLPVDGLEVVAWKVSATDRLDQFFEIEGEADQWANSSGVFDSVVSGLVTLSQASSVIAGLRAERITAERDALDAYGKLQAAEARIAELEAAIDSAEIVGGLTENGNLWRFWSQRAQETAGKAEARISSLEEENKRMREANEALMRERTSMIATHRESINRLTLKIGALEAKAEHAARQALEDHNG